MTRSTLIEERPYITDTEQLARHRIARKATAELTLLGVMLRREAERSFAGLHDTDVPRDLVMG